MRVWLTVWLLGSLACDDRGPRDVLRYAPAVERPVGEHPVAVAAIDVDGDGRPELAVPGLLTPDVTILHADGGTDTIELPGGAVSLATGDLDGDGGDELIVSMPAADLVQALRFDRQGQAQTIAEVPLDAPGPLDAGDVDGDGHIDVLVTRPAVESALALRGDGTGRLVAGAEVPAPLAASAICLDDLDRDGDVDVAMTGTDGDEMWVHLAGADTPAARGATGGWPMGVTVAQLDGDAALELVGAANLSDTIFVVDLADGGALEVRALPKTGQPAAVSAGDVDGDGHTDLAVVAKGGDSVDLLRGDGDGGAILALSLATGWGPSAVLLVDLDGDDCLDVATVNAFSNSVSVHTCDPG